MEAADAGVHVRDRVAADRIVVSDSQALAARIFSTTIFAKPCTKRVLRQAQQLEITKPAENRLFAVDRLINASHILVGIAARTSVFKKIEDRARASWISDQFVQEK